MKLKTGIEKLDEALGGGLPANSASMLLTDTLVDKSSFAQHLLSTRIIEGDQGMYLTTTKLPEQVLNNMYEHGWESKNLIFIDCISATLGKPATSKYCLQRSVLQVEPAWEEAVELLIQALRETPGFKFLVFDALETFMGVEAEQVIEQLKKVNEVIEETKTTCLYLLTNWGYAESNLERICKLVEVTVKLETVEKKLLWMNYFQVEGSPKIPYVIAATGVALYVPKILITGPFHAGKSSIVRALSERAVSVDRLGTTVALDHGYIERKGMACDLFGTPGQERFDWILKILARDVWGVILVVDSTRPETFERAKQMLEEVRGYALPYVVFANKQDLENALKPEEVAKELGLPEVVGTCAISGEGCERGLQILFDKIFSGKVL